MDAHAYKNLSGDLFSDSSCPKNSQIMPGIISSLPVNAHAQSYYPYSYSVTFFFCACVKGGPFRGVDRSMTDRRSLIVHGTIQTGAFSSALNASIRDELFLSRITFQPRWRLASESLRQSFVAGYVVTAADEPLSPRWTRQQFSAPDFCVAAVGGPLSPRWTRQQFSAPDFCVAAVGGPLSPHWTRQQFGVPDSFEAVGAWPDVFPRIQYRV